MNIFKKHSGNNTTNSLTVIGNKTFFEGQIKAYDLIRIDGTIKGHIECQGALEVGIKGKIEADIVADSVLIGGEVIGNILAKNRLEITSGGKVRGDIVTAHLVINEGVIFDGACHMITDEKAKHFPKKENTLPETPLKVYPEDSKNKNLL
ncbi:MAG TPA: polymer-forming cytoskeletal protein [Thermodesulfobacteriota bacterium]|mgnify:CR=1 FL=1|nr:polymer-forming cytoskeletal protein [Thermodesulfobacteriota bacterium]